MRSPSRTERRLAAALALAACGTVFAAERSLPVDCLPDTLHRWQAASPDPDLRFGATSLPGIVLGPPGDSLPTQGSTTVASLGNGGLAVVEWTDIVIEDRPGPDFVIFENAFWVGFVPGSPGEDFQVFVEPGVVSVSADGRSWYEFPYDAQALADAVGRNADRALWTRLRGLAGVTPTFAGDWTVPDDPGTWDPAGTGGVSGAGGDAFDLADVGLSEARFVRIVDGGTLNGAPGPAEGFDLDAVVVLHGRPLAAGVPDRDGDGLGDAAEVAFHGTDPDVADSDGDGLDDGREVAGCRDPAGTAAGPRLEREPRLWVTGGPCHEIRWSFLGTGFLYDLIRGDLESLALFGGGVDLGPALCLADDTPAVRWSCDADLPAASRGFYYLARESAGSWGRSSGLDPRDSTSGCP